MTYIGLQSTCCESFPDRVRMYVWEILLLEVGDVMCVGVCQHVDCLVSVNYGKFGRSSCFLFEVAIVFTFCISVIDAIDGTVM